MSPFRFDKSRLEEIHVDQAGYYALHIDRTHRIAVLEVVITWIAWYSVYFWLTAEELHLFRHDKPAFDRLAEAYAKHRDAAPYRQRQLAHEGPGGPREPGDPPLSIDDL